MRMWNIDPTLMCKKHLLGEHVEMHMFVGSVKKNFSMYGYASTGLVEMHNIQSRHDQLVHEMTKRGMNHNTPLEFDHSSYGVVNIEHNYWEISRRCERCREAVARAVVSGKVRMLSSNEFLKFVSDLEDVKEAT